MTDNEIIKALECCYDLNSSAICHQCPLYQTEDCREGYLGLQAYHLINRLMDKNKAYKHYYDECLKDLKKANAEIERLKADNAEVRHGEWKDNRNGTFTCSVCGGNSSKMDWCGRCGAKMDGKGDG